MILTLSLILDASLLTSTYKKNEFSELGTNYFPCPDSPLIMLALQFLSFTSLQHFEYSQFQLLLHNHKGCKASIQQAGSVSARGTCHFPDTISSCGSVCHTTQTAKETVGPSQCLKTICTLVLKTEQVVKIKAC